MTAKPPRKHVVVVSQYYVPEPGAPSARISMIVRGIVARGARVTVVCAMPNYPQGIKRPEDRRRLRSVERVDAQITIVRTYVKAFPDRSAGKRLVTWMSFCLSALLAFRFTRGADVVIASSGPLFVVIPGLIFSAFRRAPFVLDARDVWPTRATDVLTGTKRVLATAILRPIEVLAYKFASRIVAATRGNEKEIVARGAVASRVTTIRSGGDADQSLLESRPIEDILGPAARTDELVLVVGTIGFYQAPTVVLEAAAILLAARRSAWVVFVGDGPDRSDAQALAGKLGLDRVLFTGAVPRADLLPIVRRARVGVVALEPTMRLQMLMAVPRRMSDYLTAGLPIAYSGDGEGADLIRAAGAGVVAPPGDVSALAQACEELLGDAAKWEACRTAAWALAQDEFSFERMAGRYSDVLAGLLDRPRYV